MVAKINTKKLNELLETHGLTASLVSRSMGYNSTALRNAMRREQISFPMATALEANFGIKLQDYRLPVENAAKPMTNDDMRHDALTEQEIRTIVKDELRKLLNRLDEENDR